VALLALNAQGQPPATDLATLVTVWAEQVGWLGLWGSLMGALLAARDRVPGMDGVLGSLPLARTRYVAGQVGALALLVAVGAAVTAVALWLPARPDLGASLLPGELDVALPALPGALLLTWLGLAVSHLVRGPLVFVVPLVVSVVLVTLSQVVPHTLSLSPDVRCSALLGCPPLPYLLQASWVLLLALLVALLAARTSRWLPLHDSAGAGARLGGGALTLLALLGLGLPTLSRAAQTYPRPDWRTAPAWPAVNHRQPQLAAVQVPSYAYHCTAPSPRVCLPRGDAALAGRIRSALHHLPEGTVVPDVQAYPDVEVGFTRRQRRVGNTLYVSEQTLRQAQMTLTHTSTAADGTRRVVQQQDTVPFLHALTLHVLRGTETSGQESEREGDGIVTRAEQLDALGVAQHYRAWLALRNDLEWPRAFDIIRG